MPIGHLYVFFGKMFFQVLCPFFLTGLFYIYIYIYILLLSSISSLYLLFLSVFRHLSCFLIFLSILIFLINLLILFIYFWLHWVFVAACRLFLAAASGGYSSLWCVVFSLQWLLLLQSTGSRHVGFSSCGTRAQ